MKGCRPLTDEEIRRVEPLLGPRDRALFILGVRAGFRTSELLSLTVGDVWQLGRVVDQVSVERRHMKKKTEGRTVPLHASAKAALEAWLAELARTVDAAVLMALDPQCPLFPSRKRGPEGRPRPITRRQALRAYKSGFAAAGVTGKTGTHSCRKAFAARVYQRLKGDLVKTQKALGHRSVSSTVSYISFADRDVDDAILGD